MLLNRPPYFALLLLICCLQHVVCSQDIRKSLTNELNQLILNASIEGGAAAIFTSDSLLYSHGFGYSSINENIRTYTPDTRQKIASLSKLLLGVALVKAQEMDLLDLDDDVNSYLPFKLTNPHYPEKVITIRHLATHTSGLDRLPKYDLKAIYTPTKIPQITDELPFGLRKMFFNSKIKSINNNKELSLSDFLYNLYAVDGAWYSKGHFLKAVPGEETSYSNAGASLIALIIEKVGNTSYVDFVRTHILDPLKMDNTTFDFESGNVGSVSSDAYHAGLVVPNNYRLLLYPIGGVASTVSDFYHFMSGITKGLENESPILSKESVTELLHPQFGNLTHGILWETSEDYIGHAGDILGATTFAYYNVKDGIGYLLFCNTGGTSTIYKETREMRSKLKEYFGQFASTIDK